MALALMVLVRALAIPQEPAERADPGIVEIREAFVGAFPALMSVVLFGGADRFLHANRIGGRGRLLPSGRLLATSNCAKFRWFWIRRLLAALVAW